MVDRPKEDDNEFSLQTRRRRPRSLFGFLSFSKESAAFAHHPRAPSCLVLLNGRSPLGKMTPLKRLTNISQVREKVIFFWKEIKSGMLS